MALVLVRLKIALLRGGLRGAGVRGVVGMVLAAVLSITVGTVGAALFSLARFLPTDRATDAVCAGFALMLFIWVFGPILAATSDGTLDPARLALFPLPMNKLMPGLLCAAIVGFGGLASVLALFGVVIAMSTRSFLSLLTVAAVGIQLLLCVALGRLVATAISGAARSRRWRDVAMFAGPVVALTINLVIQVWLRSSLVDGERGEAGDFNFDERFASLRLAVRMLPSGLPGMATGFAREGRVLPAVASLVAALAVVVVVLWFWHRVLLRTLTSASPSQSKRVTSQRELFPNILRFLPRTRVGAVAAKELLLMWRDPRQRMAVLGPLVGAAAPILLIRAIRSSNPSSVLFAAAVAYAIAAGAGNYYGFDGKAHWTNIAAGDDARSDLLGKNIARLLLASVIGLVAIAGLSVRAGSAAFALPAIGLSIVSLGVVVGLGNVVSVRAPYPMPASTTNIFSGGNTGNGMSMIGPALAMMFTSAVFVAPFATAFVLIDDAAIRLVLSIASAATGVAIWYAGWRHAVGYSQPRQAELLAALQPRHG